MKIVFILNVWSVLELMKMNGAYRKLVVVASFLRNVSKRECSYDFAE